jgi:hypothetical protein
MRAVREQRRNVRHATLQLEGRAADQMETSGWRRRARRTLAGRCARKKTEAWPRMMSERMAAEAMPSKPALATGQRLMKERRPPANWRVCQMRTKASTRGKIREVGGGEVRSGVVMGGAAVKCPAGRLIATAIGEQEVCPWSVLSAGWRESFRTTDPHGWERIGGRMEEKKNPLPALWPEGGT